MSNLSNTDTIPAGKFQIIQTELNKELHRKIKTVEEKVEKLNDENEVEKKEQKEILLRLNNLETRYSILSKFLWLLGGSTVTAIISIIVWLLKK